MRILLTFSLIFTSPGLGTYSVFADGVARAGARAKAGRAHIRKAATWKAGVCGWWRHLQGRNFSFGARSGSFRGESSRGVEEFGGEAEDSGFPVPGLAQPPLALAGIEEALVLEQAPLFSAPQLPSLRELSRAIKDEALSWPERLERLFAGRRNGGDPAVGTLAVSSRHQAQDQGGPETLSLPRPPAPPPAPAQGAAKPSGRLDSIDWARGLAIALMIPRNLSYVLLGVEQPIWFMAMGALVPALFLTLNGFVIHVSAQKHGRFSFYLQKGLRLLLVSGIVVDAAIWRIVPFTTVDILTTISFMIPAVYLLEKLRPRYQVAAAGAVFLLSSFLWWAGYPHASYPLEMDLNVGWVSVLSWAALFFAGNHLLKRYALKAQKGTGLARSLGLGVALPVLLLGLALAWVFSSGPFTLSETALAALAENPGILQHYLIDGWFPLLPWAGFAFLGSYLASHYRNLYRSGAANFRSLTLGWGAVVLALGSGLLWLFPPELIPRGEYTMFFSPPGLQYLLLATGGVLMVIGSLFSLRDNRIAQKAFAPLKTMGRRSLEIYIFHLAFGYPLLQLVFGVEGLAPLSFAAVTALTVFLSWGLAALMEKWWPGRPLL